MKKKAGMNIVSLGEEIAILNEDTGKYHMINEIGSIIWNQLEEYRDIEDLINHFFNEYDVSRQECADDINTFINSLIELELINL